jgi:hypothetical protein
MVFALEDNAVFMVLNLYAYGTSSLFANILISFKRLSYKKIHIKYVELRAPAVKNKQ